MIRALLLAALPAIILAGCAAYDSPTPAPPAGASGSGSAGRVPSIGRDLPPAGATLLEQARQQRRAGQLAQAGATLERAVRIAPTHPAVWQELGQLRFEEGDYAQAEQMGRKALSLSPEGSIERSRAADLVADAQRAQRRP